MTPPSRPDGGGGRSAARLEQEEEGGSTSEGGPPADDVPRSQLGMTMFDCDDDDDEKKHDGDEDDDEKKHGGGGGDGDSVAAADSRDDDGDNDSDADEEAPDGAALLPLHRSLLLRHRSPSSVGRGVSAASALRIRQQIDRITEDSAAQTRHAVPVPAGVAAGGEEGEAAAEPVLAGGGAAVAGDRPAPRRPTAAAASVRRLSRGAAALCSTRTLANYAKHSVPFQACPQLVGRSYTLGTFGRDALAGVTVAIMAVPLSMSYAKLAGLPAYYGLYATFVPPLIYPLLGTSRQLAVGPAALVSLLVSSGVSKIVVGEGLSDPTSDEYVERYAQLAIQCGFLVGLINLAMGLLRLGFVTQFLSKALISGFTSGAAVLIAASQVKLLFGYQIPPSSTVQQTISYLVQNIDEFNWKTFVMGSVCIVVLVAFKYISGHEGLLERYPAIKWTRAIGPVFVSIFAIVLTYALHLDNRGITVVGYIPPGLPAVTVDQWTPLSSQLLVRTAHRLACSVRILFAVKEEKRGAANSSTL